jgi:predicted  nucleic acid-binding Zn-ribbon protein
MEEAPKEENKDTRGSEYFATVLENNRIEVAKIDKEIKDLFKELEDLQDKMDDAVGKQEWNPWMDLPFITDEEYERIRESLSPVRNRIREIRKKISDLQNEGMELKGPRLP